MNQSNNVNDILDEKLNKDDIDESKINKATSIIRYVIFGFLVAVEFRSIYRQTLWFKDNFNSSQLEPFLFHILGVIALGFFIYYNLKQADKEKNHQYIYPVFRGMTSLVFIIYSILLMMYFMRRSIFFFEDESLGYNSVSFFLVTLLIAYVTYREVIYLKRKKST